MLYGAHLSIVCIDPVVYRLKNGMSLNALNKVRIHVRVQIRERKRGIIVRGGGGGGGGGVENERVLHSCFKELW